MTTRQQLNDLTAVQQCLNVSRSTVYQLLASGQLGSIKIGARRMVTDQQIDDFIEHLQQGGAA